MRLYLLLIPTLLLLCSCGQAGSGGGADLAFDVLSVEVAGGIGGGRLDGTSPDDTGETAPALRAWFSPFMEVPVTSDGPTVFLAESGDDPNGPSLATFDVYARNLGLVGGLAFYLEFDPASLTLVAWKPEVDMGSSGPYITKAIFREIRPGVVTFGAARFCHDKLPWGSVDQCGGVTLDSDVLLGSLTFELHGEGQSALRFPKSHTLIRRPDRSVVEAQWIGGSVAVGLAEWEVGR